MLINKYIAIVSIWTITAFQALKAADGSVVGSNENSEEESANTCAESDDHVIYSVQLKNIAGFPKRCHPQNNRKRCEITLSLICKIIGEIHIKLKKFTTKMFNKFKDQTLTFHSRLSRGNDGIKNPFNMTPVDVEQRDSVHFQINMTYKLYKKKKKKGVLENKVIKFDGHFKTDDSYKWIEKQLYSENSITAGKKLRLDYNVKQYCCKENEDKTLDCTDKRKPAGKETKAGKPTKEKSGTKKPTVEKSATIKPTVEKSGTKKPTVEKSGTKKPTVENSGTKNATAGTSTTPSPSTKVPTDSERLWARHFEQAKEAEKNRLELSNIQTYIIIAVLGTTCFKLFGGFILWCRQTKRTPKDNRSASVLYRMVDSVREFAGPKTQPVKYNKAMEDMRDQQYTQQKRYRRK